MTQTLVHQVFTPSGAGCLVQALRKAGRSDKVVSYRDNLSFGPIDPVDPSARAKWVATELGPTDWNFSSAGSERVWDDARFPDNRKIAWLTRRSAMEYAGFLDWVWQLGEAPCEVVDLTEVKVSYPPEHALPPGLAISLGMLHHDTIRNNKLWDLAEPLQMTERHQYRQLWQQLCSENAPLRIIDGGTLVSAPISFFDSVLMSYATGNWQKVSRIVGQALGSQMDDDVCQTGDMLLAARINTLAETGRLEIRGESALEMQGSEVRLPRA